MGSNMQQAHHGNSYNLLQFHRLEGYQQRPYWEVHIPRFTYMVSCDSCLDVRKISFSTHDINNHGHYIYVRLPPYALALLVEQIVELVCSYNYAHVWRRDLIWPHCEIGSSTHSGTRLHAYEHATCWWNLREFLQWSHWPRSLLWGTKGNRFASW